MPLATLDLMSPAEGRLGISELTVSAPPAPPREHGLIRLAVHRGPGLPENPDGFDVLLTTKAGAPRPWVSVEAGEIDGLVAELDAAVARKPIAASVLTQVLRMGPRLSFAEAIVVESLAYSMLLAGAEFRAWRAASPVQPRGPSQGSRVRLAREGDLLVVTLSRPEARNAVDARMRDALVEALAFALIDPDGAVMELRGEGPAFCAGGDLDEFGQAAGDPAVAHDIRVEQSPARLMHELGARGRARLHGACIGAGIEIPAAAARVTAARDTTCRLPEVSMGLIPGAGGTASIPHRIGRERACFMALSGRAVDAQTALDWGLIDALEDT